MRVRRKASAIVANFVIEAKWGKRKKSADYLLSRSLAGLLPSALEG